VPSSRPALSGPIPLPAGFVTRIISRGQGTRSLCCPDCSVPLDLLQPDENEPARLLGTCESCSKWVFLVELKPDWSKVLLIELPSTDTIRQGLPATPGSRRGRRAP
jgi:hypothetical protein